MKSTGVVRKTDQLGRVVLPKELRGGLDINEKDPLEIFVEGESIILRKYQSHMACAITGEITSENKVFGNGKIVLSPKGAEILEEEITSRGVK